MVEFKTLNKYTLGDMIAHYFIDEGNHIEWMLYPKSLREKACFPEYQRTTYSLVQAKLWKDNYDKNFFNGETMFNSETARRMTYVCQKTEKDKDKFLIITALTDHHNNFYHQYVEYQNNTSKLTLWSDFTNQEKETVKLEYLTSFVLNSLSPFSAKNIPGNLDLIRMRSKWAMEGRIEENPIEDYDLEESWKASGLALMKIGQNGTMPVRKFFPFLGIKDKKNDVTWLANYDARASWQMNVGRVDDRLTMFGGLPDHDNGAWFKDVKPTETFTTPKANITVGQGSLLSVSRRLLSIPKKKSLPIIYNEWGTTWGHPNEKLIEDSLPLLKKHGVNTYVIDAGWYQADDPDFNRDLGNWNVDKKAFLHGLKLVTDKIHTAGMHAGIWYEFEGLGDLSKKYQDVDSLVTRDGWPVTTMKRRFLDLRKQSVRAYLEKVMVQPLTENNFDYLKVDYNDSIGLGIDGADSLAQGIQDEISCSLDVFKELHDKIPNLEIENCSSGGHRLVPAFINQTEYSSFSDAHETTSIPIIAANELNIIPANKNLIWCVVHPDDSLIGLQYHLIASFLGRICLSGDIRNLSQKQWSAIDEGFEFYKGISDLINQNYAFRIGPKVLSYHDPTGYQVVGFSNQEKLANSNRMVVFIHQFAESRNIDFSIRLKGWHVVDSFGNKNIKVDPKIGKIKLSNQDFSALAIVLERNYD